MNSTAGGQACWCCTWLTSSFRWSLGWTSFSYDLPSLLFFCACLYCVISRRMLWFYLFFVVGTFNRETICMATLYLAIWGWEESKGREDTLALGGHVLTQAAIWIVIKLYLHHLFAGNLAETAGATFYYKLGYNLRIFLKRGCGRCCSAYSGSRCRSCWRGESG